MGEIYKIVNDFNDKVYIGKTLKNTEVRKKEHLKQLNDGSLIHNIILKYGINHFTWIVIESNIFDKELLSEREKYWISYYNSYLNGYNMTKGGEGGNGTHARNLIQWRKDNPEQVQVLTKNFIEWQKENINEMRKAWKKGAKIRKEKYGKDITKEANKKVRKKVKCIETNKIYESATEAARDVGGINGSHIGQVCNKKRKTAYKYHWEWATEVN